MTIQELMRQVDADRVTEAFMLVNWIFKSVDYVLTIAEKFKAISKIRDAIRENIELFRECNPSKSSRGFTVFISEDLEGEDFENKEATSLSCYGVYDDEVMLVLDKDFCLFTDSSEIRLEIYSFDHDDICEMANHVIAKSSIDKLGKELCAAQIFSDMFFWGITPEERKESVDSLTERLKASDDKEEYVPLEEFEKRLNKMRDELLQNMSEDERAYDEAKDRFEEETKEIEQRYWKKVVREIEKQHIAAIKEEYKSRIK